MVTIRRLAPREVEPLVRDLWIDFHEELAAVDGYDDLPDAADGILGEDPPDEAAVADAVAARRERVDHGDALTFVAVADGTGEISFALGSTPDADGSDGENLVGFVAAEYLDPSPVADGAEVTVDELYVRPDRRGERIADALLAAAEAWATHRDCVVVRLSVSEENGTARAVYERRNYGETPAGMVRILR